MVISLACITLLRFNLLNIAGEFVWPRENETDSCSRVLYPPNANSQFELRHVEKCPSLLTKKPNPSDQGDF